MTRTELNKFQAILTAKHAEITGTTGRRDGLTIERVPDALDEVQLAAERELTGRGLERESKLLRNVRTALGRIAEGAIRCQERADRNLEPHFAPEEILLKAA